MLKQCKSIQDDHVVTYGHVKYSEPTPLRRSHSNFFDGDKQIKICKEFFRTSHNKFLTTLPPPSSKSLDNENSYTELSDEDRISLKLINVELATLIDLNTALEAEIKFSVFQIECLVALIKKLEEQQAAPENMVALPTVQR